MTMSNDTQERIDTAALRAALAVEASVKAELEKFNRDIQAKLDHYHNANVSAAGAYAATLKNEGRAKKTGPFE